MVSTVSSSTRAPTSIRRIPTTPANGARTVRSASCFWAPSSRALAPSEGRLELVDGRLRDRVVGSELARPLERQLGLAQRGLRLATAARSICIVEADQHRARLDPLRPG